MTDTDTKLDVPALIELIETLVAAAPQGANTERSCYYKNREAVFQGAAVDIDSSTPAHCIAGQVVFTLGGIEALNSLSEHDSIAPTAESYKYATEGELGNQEVASQYLTPEAIRVLYRAQVTQDNRETWGAMVKDIKKESTNV